MGYETPLPVMAGIFMACLVGVVFIGLYLLVGYLEERGERLDQRIRDEQFKMLSKDKHTAKPRKQEEPKVGPWGNALGVRPFKKV